MSCGCVVLYGGSGAGGVRGALDDQGHWVRGSQGCSRLDGCGAGASVYLGPGAEAACRNASTAAGCPGSPCPTCPPRSCNTTYCSKAPRKPPGTGHFFPFPRSFFFFLLYPFVFYRFVGSHPPNLSLSLYHHEGRYLAYRFHATFEVSKDQFAIVKMETHTIYESYSMIATQLSKNALYVDKYVYMYRVYRAQFSLKLLLV